MIPPIWPGAPRHRPERTLPSHAFVPGRTPRPPGDGEEKGDFLWGIDLYHAGYLWEAHEAWEGVWKAAADPAERELLQALIQIAAALLKAHVGEEAGARKLAGRARARLRSVPDRCMGVDVSDLLRQLDACFGVEIDWSRAPRLEPGAP